MSPVANSAKGLLYIAALAHVVAPLVDPEVVCIRDARRWCVDHPGLMAFSPFKTDGLMNTILQRVLRVLVLLLTLGAFGYYLWRHPELVRQLGHTPPHVLAQLLFLYLAWFCTTVLALHGTLRICGMPLRPGENVLLNAYSILVNFFVPGQGGVAVRGLYMKKRHQLGFSRYILATLIYYMCYAVVSAVMLLISSRPWWQTCAGIAVVIAGGVLVLGFYERRAQTSMSGLSTNLSNMVFLLFATLSQVAAQAAVFGRELRTIDPSITLPQVVTYTGAANFSVFVALTPGAIGIRESFLVLTHSLHHIKTTTILAASLLDRSVFLVFLGLLFVFSQAFHAKRNLGV